jgi:hypothetical protein
MRQAAGRAPRRSHAPPAGQGDHQGAQHLTPANTKAQALAARIAWPEPRVDAGKRRRRLATRSAQRCWWSWTSHSRRHHLTKVGWPTWSSSTSNWASPGTCCAAGRPGARAAGVPPGAHDAFNPSVKLPNGLGGKQVLIECLIFRPRAAQVRQALTQPAAKTTSLKERKGKDDAARVGDVARGEDPPLSCCLSPRKSSSKARAPNYIIR